MRPYKLVVEYAALEFMQALRKAQQRDLHARLLNLKDFPHNLGYRVEGDHVCRDYLINVGGKFAIKYWIDEAVREVRILDIQFVKSVK